MVASIYTQDTITYTKSPPAVLPTVSVQGYRISGSTTFISTATLAAFVCNYYLPETFLRYTANYTPTLLRDVYIRNSGVYKNTIDPKMKLSGTYRQVQTIYIKYQGVWVPKFQV